MPWVTGQPGRSVPYRLQQQCFRRDDWTCQACGYEGRQVRGDLHADHIVAREFGGENEIDNLRTLCARCHGLRTNEQSKAARAAAARRRRACGHRRRIRRITPKIGHPPKDGTLRDWPLACGDGTLPVQHHPPLDALALVVALIDHRDASRLRVLGAGWRIEPKCRVDNGSGL
jgi:5-methylcytosine-specific restriction enzyme A